MKVLITVLIFVATASAVPSTRIFGGEDTTIDQYPSMVQVEASLPPAVTWQHWCGASILNALYVLSAAHCFYGPLYERSRRRIRAGSSYSYTGGTIIYIAKEINHPSFNFWTADYDVTVVLLSSPLIMSPVIQPASIVRQNAVVPDNAPVVVVGWGFREDFLNSPVLQHVTVYTVNREICRYNYDNLEGMFKVVTENMMCTGLLGVGGKGACGGDSGGPVYFANIVVGIGSWSDGCGQPDYPTVNVNVASFTDWIVETAV